LLEYDEDGNLDQSSVIPLVDGGTEGFKGNARVVLPGLTACTDCTLDLYPPQVIASLLNHVFLVISKSVCECYPIQLSASLFCSKAERFLLGATK